LPKFVAALVIYISVLEQQAKYRDALEILSGDLGSLIGIEADKLRMQVVFKFHELVCGTVLFFR